MATKQTKTRSIGLMTILFIVFLVLKLTGTGAVADWSWWWVTCPLWIIPAIWLVMIICFGLLALIYGLTVEKR